jgi:hypothetical protein
MAAASSTTPETQQGTPSAAEAHAAEDAVVDPERQPLLDKPHHKPHSQTPRKRASYLSSFFSSGDSKQGEDEEDDWDSTSYDITRITSWQAFCMVKGCAWDNGSLWFCIGLGLLLALAVAGATVLLPTAGYVNPETLSKLGTFLNVFVGLLLGFFLTSSMNRWYGCVTAFLELLDAVRSMQMQMTALGVSPERSSTLSRYGILSAWLLHLSLNLESEERGTAVSEEDTIDKVWEKLEEFRPQLVLPQEKTKLMQHSESYALLWTWVASLVGRMSQDGEIPPMASPTYGRILNIVQDAYGSIRNVRALQLIKAPFIYIHTLAVLVHVNNILNAVSFGIVLGINVSGLFIVERGKSGLANMHASLLMQFVFSMIAPILYLALLDVSVCISQPFTYKDAKIPAARFIRCLEDDLKKAASMGDSPPLWEKPSFKRK